MTDSFNIIMNPPYDGSLHLQILEKALTFKSENGTCVCLHPARWIEDPLWKYKSHSDHEKYQKSIIDKITSLFIIDAAEAQKLFNIAIWSDIAITIIANKKLTITYNNIILSIIDKILVPCSKGTFPSLKSVSTTGSYSLNIPRVHGHVDCKDQFEITSSNYDEALKSKSNDKEPVIINFITEDERLNFYKSISCNFYQNLKKISGIGRVKLNKAKSKSKEFERCIQFKFLTKANGDAFSIQAIDLNKIRKISK